MLLVVYVNPSTNSPINKFTDRSIFCRPIYRRSIVDQSPNPVLFYHMRHILSINILTSIMKET